MIGRFSIVVASVLLCLLATGCRRGNRGESAGLTQSVTLILDWTPNVNHVGIFVAQELGYFSDEALEVDVIQPGEVVAAAAVEAGVADFGVDFQENLTLLRAQETSLVSIAAVIQRNTSGFAVRAEDGITSPLEFDNMRYATFNSPFEAPTIDAIARCAGEGAGGDGGAGDISVQFVPGGTDLLAMLATNQADLAWIFYATQGIQAVHLGIDLTYFPLSDYGDCIPDYYTPIIIANEETIDERPDVARGFLAALERGYRFAAENPREAADMLATRIPESDKEVLRKGVSWLAVYLTHPRNGWGFQEERVWRDYAAWMLRTGLLEQQIAVGTTFTNRLLPSFQQ